MNTISINQPTRKQRFSALLRYFLAPKRYPSKKSFFCQLAINFAIASAVVVVLHTAEDLVFFKEIKDFTLDTLMYYHSDFEPTLANGEKMRRMALIAIDDKTYREWGFPVITPRDKLKTLIEKAVEGGANVIAVDIELSWTSDGYIHTPNELAPQLSADDQILVDYLHDINERDTAPPIILTGMYRKPVKDNGTIDNEAFFERQRSFLDEVLKPEKNVFWGSSFFVVEEDRIWRRWQLAPLVCQEGHLTVVPSLALLTALAELHSIEGNAAQNIRQLKTRFNDWAQQFSCDVKEKNMAELCDTQKTCPDFTVTLPQKEGVNDNNHFINLAAGDANQRIVYRFAPSDKPTPKRGAVIDIYSATDVLAGEAEFENQIVFIGVTHQDSGDRHPIPIRVLTDIDGVYIVANATDTLLRFGQLQRQSSQSKILKSIALVIFMATIFTCFSVVQTFILNTLLVFVLVVWAFYKLRVGVDVDVAMYSLTIHIVQTLDRFLRYLFGKLSVLRRYGKMYRKWVLILMLFLGVGMSSSQARDCPKVAKIYLADIIDEVIIWQTGTKKPIWASADNRELCAGDVVTAPNRSIPPLTIRYYTEIPKMTKLDKGENHQVEALLKPCGVWCTAWNDIKRLRYKLISQVPENVGDGIGGGREGGNDSKPVPNITMPLDIGLSNEPFYLFAREGAIPLFWEGGQPPYQLEIKDAMGQVIRNKALKNNIFSFTVPNPEPEQTYTLKISSAGSVSYQNQLIFALPPFPLDPKADQWLILTRLLNDPNKNWRLEIWRQLATMPQSQDRENFKAHLILDDF